MFSQTQDDDDEVLVTLDDFTPAVDKDFEDAEDEDALDVLLAESVPAVPNDLNDDLNDLESLFAESVTLANARKAKSKGAQLSLEQREILESARIAAEANIWQGQAVYAHVIRTSCQCGHCTETFAGWYEYQVQRKGNGRRLVSVPKAEETLHASRYTSEEAVEICEKCLPALPHTPSQDCDLLTTLGRDCVGAHSEDSQQTSFNFEEHF